MSRFIQGLILHKVSNFEYIVSSKTEWKTQNLYQKKGMSILLLLTYLYQHETRMQKLHQRA